MAWEGVEVHGTFDSQKFYDVLARILSEKYNVTITVKVTTENEKDKKEAM